MNKYKRKEQKSKIESILKQFENKGWIVRAKTAISLGRLGEPEAVPGLIKALSDENYLVRHHAADALKQIGTPEAVKAAKEWERRN